MNTREALENVLATLPEEKVQQLVEFARFLAARQDLENLRRSGEAQLAGACSSNEPESTA